MKILKHGMLILLSCFAFLGLQACEQEGAFESTGEEIDQGVDDTQDALDDAGDQIDEEL